MVGSGIIVAVLLALQLAAVPPADAASLPPKPEFLCVDCSGCQQYFQHPTDCRKFIQCAAYGPQEMPCAPGTVWDQNLLTCNHENSTQCVTGNYVDSDGNCVGCVGCTPIANTTTTTTTTPSTTTRPHFPCVDCSSGQQYFQHPTDCHKFIQCAPYGPQEMPCAPGTVWDQNLLTCNHQHSTQCVTGNYVDSDGNCVGMCWLYPYCKHNYNHNNDPIHNYPSTFLLCRLFKWSTIFPASH
ncbi:peritrophin-1-like isoform X2 [Homarus americanus]|uniref:peritrophin-1-like isoform X2 n=1 Tax=Homarus americanus TaxID=6706 RepID=UPI001C4821A9|nr:peritrophin-1-like isoform X2 [Homarus americanus]